MDFGARRAFRRMSELGLAGDLLQGADAIAEFLFGTPNDRRRIYYLAEEPNPANEKPRKRLKKAAPAAKLPIFRIGNTICARKSTLTRWIAQQEGVQE
jgi:hypothetical protein